MKVVLFCGGLGTRLRDMSSALPNPMVNIGYEIFKSLAGTDKEQRSEHNRAANCKDKQPNFRECHLRIDAEQALNTGEGLNPRGPCCHAVQSKDGDHSIYLRRENYWFGKQANGRCRVISRENSQVVRRPQCLPPQIKHWTCSSARHTAKFVD